MLIRPLHSRRFSRRCAGNCPSTTSTSRSCSRRYLSVLPFINYCRILADSIRSEHILHGTLSLGQGQGSHLLDAKYSRSQKTGYWTRIWRSKLPISASEYTDRGQLPRDVRVAEPRLSPIDRRRTTFRARDGWLELRPASYLCCWARNCRSTASAFCVGHWFADV